MPCTTPSWTKTTSKTTEGTSNEVPSFLWGGRLPGGNSPKPFRNRDRLQKIRLRRRPPPKHQDILLFGNNLEYDPAIVAKVQAVIVRAVEDGTISRARLEASWRRILKLKQQMS